MSINNNPKPEIKEQADAADKAATIFGGTDKQKTPSQKKKNFLPILLVLVASVTLLAIILVIIKRTQDRRPPDLPITSNYLTPIQDPSETPTPDTNSTPSEQDLLSNIETELKKIEKDLSQIQFRDASLYPPELDMNITFKVTD
ncbi:hypothetical protein ACFLZP_00640 [Patescibacteria group bacterium]